MWAAALAGKSSFQGQGIAPSHIARYLFSAFSPPPSLPTCPLSPSSSILSTAFFFQLLIVPPKTDVSKMIDSSVSEGLSDDAVKTFQRDGFLVHSTCIFNSGDTVVPALQARLECILNEEYDTGSPPYKANKVAAQYRVNGRFSFSNSSSAASSSGNQKKSSTIHVVNVWQCDGRFRELVTSPVLGNAVATLMGWEAYGCRVAQDQVWIKPPRSGPLSFHRDTPYLDFDPKVVCTVWIALDDTRLPKVGTLEYCVGSHLWGERRRGSANQFYHNDYRALLVSAAEHEVACGSAESKRSAAALVTVPVLGEPGCCAFHNGATWHGSGGNETAGWRRGIGIHYVRGDATFAADAGKMWQDFRISPASRELPEDKFPLVSPPRAQVLSSP